MKRIILSIILVFAVIFIVPFIVYSLFTVFTDIKIPEAPLIFMGSVTISKAGTAIVFVLIYNTARSSLSGRWRSYAFLWWLMFILNESAQALLPDYTWLEAAAGIISETIYFPVSAYITDRLIQDREKS